jgi:thiol-disulfide isomerase/thioredoxin
MGMVRAALVALVFCGSIARAADPAEGRIGVRYLLEPEGMVIIAVNPEMAAAAAGLVPGDRIIAIDGESIEGSPAGVGARVRGEVGTDLKLTVRGPLGAPEREVVLTRGKRGPRKKRARMHKVMAHFQASLRTGKGPAVAAEATQTLIDAGFLGREPAAAIGTALNKAARRHPKTARAALPVLAKVAGEDAGIHQRLGEAYHYLGEYKLALYHLSESVRLRGPDIQGADFRGNVDARFKAKEMLIQAAWEEGDKDRARALAAALVRTRDNPEMLDHLGLEHPAPPTPVRAHLPPIASFQTELLDGAQWKLEDHRGRAVLLAFWASWCGPCKKEMPELGKLWSDRKGKPFDVLAVSVDKVKDHAKVVRAADKWGMRFPVSHDPDLGRRLGVVGLPAVRLIGPDGSDRYAAKGYSPAAVDSLAHQVDEILEQIAGSDQHGAGQVIGQLWSRLPATVSQFTSVPGARSVAASPEGAVVGVRASSPMALELVDGKLQGSTERDVSTPRRATAGRVGWLDGPVGASPGGWWVLGEGEQGPWFTTLTSPLQDMTVSGAHLWVAMEDGLVALDAAGKLVAGFEGKMRSLSPDGAGGVWAVDGKNRYRFGLQGQQQSSLAKQSWSVAADGRWGGPRVIQVVQGRFGPEGESRTVAVRQDGAVIGLDGAGDPALTFSLRKAPVIAVVDVDGDLRDEVLVVIRGQGVATLKLELP